MIDIRKSSQRGHANHGWLDTSHTFSFAGYYDPKHMGFGALRVINEDRVSPGKGFGSHGHQDMEILTYVLSGALTHKDSMGNVEKLYANDLQRITAGTGIVHSEFNGSHTEPVHFLQIWLEPAASGLEPSYQQLSLQRITAGTGIVHSEFNGSHTEPVHFLQIWLEPAASGLEPSYQQLSLQRITAGTGIVHSEFNGSHTEPVHFLQIWMEPAVNGLQPGYQQLSLTEEQKLGKLVLVASGEGGGPLKIHQDVQVLIGQVEAGQELAHRLEAGRQAWVHVVRGAATVNGQPLATGDAAAVTGEPAVTLTGTDANTEVLVFDLA